MCNELYFSDKKFYLNIKFNNLLYYTYRKIVIYYLLCEKVKKIKCVYMKYIL